MVTERNFKDFLEWGDIARIHKHMTQNGTINPDTGKPYIPLSIRNYILGATKHTNTRIEQGIVSYLEQKRNVKEALKQAVQDL